MNIQEIKSAISIKAAIVLTSMTLTQQLAEDNVTLQPWAQYWDNDARVRIVMHMDVLEQIMASPVNTTGGRSFNGLAYKYEVVPAKPATATVTAVASYRRFVIITPANIIAVL